jgi:hypothetical protein
MALDLGLSNQERPGVSRGTSLGGSLTRCASDSALATTIPLGFSNGSKSYSGLKGGQNALPALKTTTRFQYTDGLSRLQWNSGVSTLKPVRMRTSSYSSLIF